MTSSLQEDVTIMRSHQTVDSLRNRHPSMRRSPLLRAAIISAQHNKTLRIKPLMRCGALEVRRNNRGLSAVAFLHQLEEDVGLFGFEIEVPQFVNVQDVDPDQRVEQAARRSISERGVHLIEEILRPDEAATIAVLNRLQQEAGRESRFPHAGRTSYMMPINFNASQSPIAGIHSTASRFPCVVANAIAMVNTYSAACLTARFACCPHGCLIQRIANIRLV